MACMMLKSTETIAIDDAFPRKATLILIQFFHNIDIIYVSGGDHEGEFEDAQLLHRSWCHQTVADHSNSNLVQQQKFKIVLAVIG